MPVVWLLYRDGPRPFSVLVRNLGASRDTLRETLDSLIANGLVDRSEGKRPAYSLSAAGRLVGDTCGGAVAAVQRHGVLDVALKKWPMLVLVVAGRGTHRYSDMKAALPGITPRALAGALRDLEHAGLIGRTIVAVRPPSTSYALTGTGQELFPAMDALARSCDAAVQRTREE